MNTYLAQGIEQVVAGAMLLILAAIIWVGTTFAEVQAYEPAEEGVGNEPGRQLPVTIIDQDGRIIVPEGTPVWDASERSYRLWDRLINNGPQALVGGYEDYLYNVVGTPVTEEEQEKILAFYSL